MFSIVRTIWLVFLHTFQKRVTVQYPDQKAYLAPRWRGRIILSRDPDGEERCVACYLCAVACPVDCIALQATEDLNGRRYPDFEMGEYKRQNLVYEKQDLLISGTGKYPGYNFWRVAGVKIGGKDKGQAEHEGAPVDLRTLLP